MHIEKYIKEGLLIIIFVFFFLFLLGQNFVFASSSNTVSVSASVGTSTTSTPPGGGAGGAGGVPPSPAKVVFEGKAYPRALVTILKDGSVAATFQASSLGSFKETLTGLSGGIYNFSIFAEDSFGNKSVTLSFTVSVLGGATTTISGIFISPTISLTPTQVEQGQKVNIFGQAFPKSRVNVFIASPKEIVKQTTSTFNGKWNVQLDTTNLEQRRHQAKAKALYGEGEQSPFSRVLSFLVLPPGALVCHGADLNFDGKVNIIDFSILLYYWGKSNPLNSCADINFSGIVDIVDFSMMMYQWTG